MARPELVLPAPGVCPPVMYFGIIVSSSARSENFSNTAINSCALLLGWKKDRGGEPSLYSEAWNCQIFQGCISEMSSPAGRRLILTPTCGPDDIPMLFASARLVALTIACESRHKSATPLPSTDPGLASYEVM